MINPFLLRAAIALEFVTLVYDTFDQNFLNRNAFTKYTKVITIVIGNAQVLTYLLEIFSQLCSCQLNFIKICKLLLAAVSINGLTSMTHHQAPVVVSC